MQLNVIDELLIVFSNKYRVSSSRKICVYMLYINTFHIPRNMSETPTRIKVLK